MDTRTGIVRTFKNNEELAKALVKNPNLIRIEPSNLTEALAEKLKTEGSVKIGRNDPCPCGSGQKFKRCCLGKGNAQEGGRHAR